MLGWSTSARNRRSATAAAMASASPVLSRPLTTRQLSLTLRSLARYIQPSPPWARRPSTSYWPPIRSPDWSFGVKENGVPQLRQKPSVSPGRPSRARPTGCSHRGQNRLLSATCGSARTALACSWAGTGGISSRPAPRFPRDDALAAARVPRVPAWPPVPDVNGNEPSPWLTVTGTGAGTGAAAIPHTVQYPLSMLPPQPGCVQVAAVVVIGAASVRRGPGSPAGSPPPRPPRRRTTSRRSWPSADGGSPDDHNCGHLHAAGLRRQHRQRVLHGVRDGRRTCPGPGPGHREPGTGFVAVHVGDRRPRWHPWHAGRRERIIPREPRGWPAGDPAGSRPRARERGPRRPAGSREQAVLPPVRASGRPRPGGAPRADRGLLPQLRYPCLLYTSDAADA